jgi:adenylate kinase family enzyme
MKINVIAVGNLKINYIRAGVADFEKRLRRHVKLNIIEVDAEKIRSGLSEAEKEQIKEKELERIKERINNVKNQKHYIFDGFPRTVVQAEAFDRFLEKNDDSLDAFILLSVPEEELIKRILSRGEGRSDDTEEKVKTRLQVYREETKPVMKHYQKQDKVQEIDGTGTIDEIFERIKAALS